MYLQIWCGRIRKSHISRKGTEYYISHLYAAWRNDITEAKMIITKKFGEVMEQHQQNPKCPFIKKMNLRPGRGNKTLGLEDLQESQLKLSTKTDLPVPQVQHFSGMVP